MGRYLSKHFVASWKKVGTFAIHTPPNGTPTKVGGNVVAYFLTPKREVVHVVFGNVDAGTFLEGARWAVDLASTLSQADAPSRSCMAAEAHRFRLEALTKERPMHVHRIRAAGTQAIYRNPWSNLMSPSYPVHEKLSEQGLPRLSAVYRYFFEEVVGEKVSDAPVRRVEARLRNYRAGRNLRSAPAGNRR